MSPSLSFGYSVIWCIFQEKKFSLVDRFLAFSIFITIFFFVSILKFQLLWRKADNATSAVTVVETLEEKEHERDICCQVMDLGKKEFAMLSPLDIYQYICSYQTIKQPSLLPPPQTSLVSSPNNYDTRQVSVKVSNLCRPQAYLALNTGRKEKFYFSSENAYELTTPLKKKESFPTITYQKLDCNGEIFKLDGDVLPSSNSFDIKTGTNDISKIAITKKQIKDNNWRRPIIRHQANRIVPINSNDSRIISLPSISEEYETIKGSTVKAMVGGSTYIPPNLILENTLSHSLNSSKKAYSMMNEPDHEDIVPQNLRKEWINCVSKRSTSLKRRSFLSISEKFHDRSPSYYEEKGPCSPKSTISLIDPWRNIFTKLKLRFAKQKR